jgi:hypothetical protein
VALTDRDLLRFDGSRLHDYDPAEAEETLREQGDVFRAQLVAARWIEGWRERYMAAGWSGRSDEWKAGWDDALRDVVAHLRQGDLVPGGKLYEMTMRDE